MYAIRSYYVFSFKYLAATLFGAQTMKIKEEKIKAKIAQIKERQDDAVTQSVKEYEEMKAEMAAQKAATKIDKK